MNINPYGADLKEFLTGNRSALRAMILCSRCGTSSAACAALRQAGVPYCKILDK